MKEGKRAEVQELRRRLAGLSEEERQALEAKALIVNVEGHLLSPTNRIMLYFQSMSGPAPTVVGGYKQWQKAGRQVLKGSKAKSILFPVGNKDEEGRITGDEIRFYAGNVFDITQTEPKSANQ